LTLNVNFTLRKIRDLCLNDNSCYADLIQQCHLNQASAYIEDEQQESDGELQLSNDTWEQKIQDDLLI